MLLAGGRSPSPHQGDGTGPHHLVRRGEQHVEVLAVLGQSPVAGLGESEVTLDDELGCSTLARTDVLHDSAARSGPAMEASLGLRSAIRNLTSNRCVSRRRRGACRLPCRTSRHLDGASWFVMFGKWGASPPLSVNGLILPSRLTQARPGPPRSGHMVSALPIPAHTMKEAFR